MITKRDISSLVKAAFLAGLKVDINDLELISLGAGKETHIRKHLPPKTSAIYIFEYKNECLKVGKAGKKSEQRFFSQHYYTSSNSSLANSLLKNPDFNKKIGKQKPINWIIKYTSRYNIYIPEKYNEYFLNFAEAYFILKCRPKFESRIK